MENDLVLTTNIADFFGIDRTAHNRQHALFGSRCKRRTKKHLRKNATDVNIFFVRR
jgi:hypothetical protein